MVEVITGAAVIGTSKAGEGGDFAVVLDDPLKPGDYTVVLRSTTEDNVVATSAQTAVIAVPETADGQVLALVEEPGAPSRLITVPSVPDAAPAEADAKGDRPAATEQAGTDTAGAEQQEVQELDTAAAVVVDEAKPDAASADEPKPEMQAEAAVPEEQAEPEAVASSEDEASPEAEEQVAAAAEPEAKPAQPAAPARVAVEAVEIEGRDVFVAGRAEVGSTVRVYANDILLGQTSTAESGRFLVEAEKDLPVGDYIVRADMLSPDNAEVVARAIVPFEREPGEKLAAVAAPQPVQAVESAVQQPETQADAGEIVVAAADGTAPAQAEEPAGEMAATQPKPEEAAQVAAAGNESNANEPRPAETAGADDAAADKPVEMAALDGTVEEGSADEGSVSTEATAAPKLQNVDGAVIIRRGDTLWQLSRRVYGRGVRYTTIYLANQDQIADPDRIWPGQVFSVPGETGEGETADMSAVAEQVAGPGEQAEEVVTR
ncbi:MAG: LysM peptidoglycan-binding domain-containing protein [Rhizobiaceae bacterium]|nr:LysM peptidoglycan-binding domain-containing protein [Rhizobiaceae bacterium]